MIVVVVVVAAGAAVAVAVAIINVLVGFYHIFDDFSRVSVICVKMSMAINNKYGIFSYCAMFFLLLHQSFFSTFFNFGFVRTNFFI